MPPTGVASAASVLASAPSKAPFYVAGGLLACWAVLLAAMGVTHPDFPGSGARARLVMLMSAVLVAATITAAVATGGEPSEEREAQPEPSPPSGTAEPSATLRLVADPTGQPRYDKKDVAVRAGSITIELVNRSPSPHNVTIVNGTRTLATTRTIQTATTTRDAKLPAGDYVFFCSVDAHRQAGMEGRLTVR